MLAIGLLTGFLVKEIDIYFYAQHFGISLSDIFSEVGIWVVIGVAISLFSRSAGLAMANIFLFSVGMLFTYYLTAQLTGSVFGWSYVRAWFLFACFSPLFAWLVTLTKRRGFLPFFIKLGVFAGYLGINLLLGSFLKVYDLVFFLLLLYLLFVRKYENPGEPGDNNRE